MYVKRGFVVVLQLGRLPARHGVVNADTVTKLLRPVAAQQECKKGLKMGRIEQVD
jgi:hypothetical protein